MHIESAKLLAFTEDEFVKVLELGDKVWIIKFHYYLPNSVLMENNNKPAVE